MSADTIRRADLNHDRLREVMPLIGIEMKIREPVPFAQSSRDLYLGRAARWISPSARYTDCGIFLLTDHGVARETYGISRDDLAERLKIIFQDA